MALPRLYLDDDGNPRPLEEAIAQVAELGVQRYVPEELRGDAHFEKPALVEVTADEFLGFVRGISEIVYTLLPQYFGEKVDICMNVTAMMTDYLHEIFGFPVIGLYRKGDYDLPYYLRPTTAVLDHRVCFPERAKAEQTTFEDLIEVKVADEIFLVDFRFRYKPEGPNTVLIEQAKDRKRLVRDFGLYTTQYSGFRGIKDWQTSFFYYAPVSGYFAWMVGDPDTARWNMRTTLTGAEYIRTLSSGALVTRQGYSACDLSGSGRVWFPKNIADRELLLHLPERYVPGQF